MALINCPECGKQISDKAVACPNCGAPVSVTKSVTSSSNKSSTNNPNRSGFMKVCRYCKASMPKEDTICPHCKKSQITSDGWIVSVILVVLGFLFVSMLLTSFISNKSKQQHIDEKPTIEIVEKAENQSSISGIEKVEEEIIDYTNSKTLYYMDLYENYEDYIGDYVTISAPLSYVDEDTVNIKGDIKGATGMIHITLLDPHEGLAEGDFITVAGLIDNKALGYLYMNNASILDTGDEPCKIYNQQKEEYDALSMQKANEEIETYKEACETLKYEDILRNPDTYDGKYCVLSGKVEQVIEGWFDSYTIFVTDASGNIWGCVYSYNEGESHLLEGDSVTIYGECKGTENAKTLLGKQVALPRIDVEYIN